MWTASCKLCHASESNIPSRVQSYVQAQECMQSCPCLFLPVALVSRYIPLSSWELCPWLPGISQPVKRTKQHATSTSKVTLEELFYPGSAQGENRWGRADLIFTGGGGLGDCLHSGEKTQKCWAAMWKRGTVDSARWSTRTTRTHVSSPGLGTQDCPVLWVCLGDLVVLTHSPVLLLHPSLWTPEKCCKGQTGESRLLRTTVTLPWPAQARARETVHIPQVRKPQRK